MIPDNPNVYLIEGHNKYLVAPLISPDNRHTPKDELTDYERGGVALQDTSKGLNYQNWVGYWKSEDSTAYIQIENSLIPPLAIFTESNVVEFCFTFDQNMRWVAATRKADKSMQLRWYDSAAASYVISTYSDIISMRLCIDDKRQMQINSGNTDVILTYLSGNAVHWRIQRDRYLIQYTKTGLFIPLNFRISHFGMNSLNRLQWRIGPRHLDT